MVCGQVAAGRLEWGWGETFDSLHTAIFLLDPEMRIIDVNEWACSSLGLAREEIIGSHCWEIVHGTREPIDICPMTRMLETGESESQEVILGDRIFVVTADPVRGQHGDLVGAVHWLQDVTVQRAAEDALILANNDLERRVAERTERLERVVGELRSAKAARDVFLSSLSHELRNPLNSVIGFSSLLLADTEEPLGTEQRRQVEMVRDAGRHLLELVEDSLDLARIGEGHLDARPETVDVSEVAREASESVVSASGSGVALDASGAQSQCLAFCDRRRLRQIVLNLVGNAFKYTDEGVVTIRVSSSGDFVSLDVCDTGCGIAPEDLDHVFERFYRSENARSAADGAGLGLSVSQALAHAMRGELTASSEPGRGSRFTLRLPAAR